MKFIKINAVWCGACIITNKTWKEVKNKYPDIVLEELDYDFDDVEEYNVGEILPVVLVYENEKEIDRLVGEKSPSEIFDFVEKYK